MTINRCIWLEHELIPVLLHFNIKIESMKLHFEHLTQYAIYIF